MRVGIAVALAAAWYGIGAPATHARHAERQGEPWSWNGRLAAGKTLEIRGISGSISADAATGDQVSVTARKHGRDDDPAEVRIEVVESDAGVTICAVYPGRGNQCRPGGSEMHTHDNDVEVDFTVHVPRGVRFEGDNVNGDVDATNLAGPVELNTVNGGVRLETAGGDAEAETVNGSITATIHALGTGPLRFHTVNGGITLALPADLSADLNAKTVNGSIQSDFAITVQGRMNPRELSGRIGQGGRTLELETVNGSIRLRRLP
jgi:putative adhesin